MAVQFWINKTCTENQWTGFYMTGTSVINKLIAWIAK